MTSVLNKKCIQLLPASIPSRATIGPPTNRHLRMVVRWRTDSGPIVRADWILFYKVYFVLLSGIWQLKNYNGSMGSYRNKHPQPNTGCVDPEGVRWSGPTPPHPPKKSHVLWVSIEISIPRHPKINKKTVTPHLVRRNAARYIYFLEFQMFTGEILMRLSVCTYKTQSETGKWAITYF